MKNLKRTVAALLVTLLCLGGIGASAFAEEQSEATVTLPVTQIFNLSGDAAEAAEDCSYQLVGDADEPMPQGSIDGIYTFTLKGTTEAKLSMTYAHAGVWHYTLKPVALQTGEGYSCEDKTYQIDVYVKNTDDGGLLPEVVVSDEATGQKTDGLVYTHSFQGKVPQSTPQDNVATGISSENLLYLGLILGAILLAAVKNRISKARS
ncbi:MAG: FctA domain-containing protein [Eubacterium sp.]|nr:FctA domain-containing protein [Eubacterium sp.]